MQTIALLREVEMHYRRSREWYPKRRANRQRRLSNASKDDLSQAPAHGELRWSFEKFLISRGGKVMARFASDLTVDQNVLVKAIERELEVPMKPRRRTAPLGRFFAASRVARVRLLNGSNSLVSHVHSRQINVPQ